MLTFFKEINLKYFTTGFLIKKGTARRDVIGECLSWVLSSPHTSFTRRVLNGVDIGAEFELESTSEKISLIIHDEPDCNISCFRYTKISSPQKWITDISINENKDEQSIWIQVESEVLTQEAVYKAPETKKPLIVMKLIEKFSGGYDDVLVVNTEPVFLEDNKESLELSSKIINSELNNRLPVVYVSSKYFYSEHAHNIIPERLSRKLSGLAHVLIEPASRSFSDRLKYEVNFHNAYGGTIGIYWPNGQGVTFHRRGDSTAKDLEDELFKEILAAITTLAPLRKCGWNEVYNAKIKGAITILKQQGASTDQLITLYEEENQTLQEEIENLKFRISNFESRLRVIQSKASKQGDLTLSLGDEIDFFENEALEFIIHSLEKELATHVKEKSRHRDILSAIINSNHINKEIPTKDNRLKQTLKDYSKMSPKCRTELKSLGFSIDEGGHYKITYYEDSRYTYILPKTGSDHRGAKNAYSDISGMIFY